MIRHYLTFLHQAALLDERLQGWHLAECWSQEKNLLLLRFVDDEGRSLFVEVSLDLKIGYTLLREDIHRARRNTVDFFNDLLGVSLRHVSIDEGERLVRLQFDDGSVLALVFFGKGGGNILHLRDGKVVRTFKRYDGEYDALLPGEEEVDETHDRSAILARLADGVPPADKSLAGAIPGLGRRLALEALYRCGVDPSRATTDLGAAELAELLDTVDRLYADCMTTSTFHLYRSDDGAVLSLVPLQSIANDATAHDIYNDIGEAIRNCRSASYGIGRYRELHDGMLRRLAWHHSRGEKALAHRLDSASHLARADEWELFGGIVMANLTAVERGMKSIELPDWEGTPRTIPLNEKLSAVENAEHYFKRARGAREQSLRASKGVEGTREELARIEDLLHRVEVTTTISELETITKENIRLFMSKGETKEEGTAERFRRFQVHGGLDVYAGKNAANNDELTVRFARPNDYWFHARGSSGSHVILRWGDPKTKPPKEAIRAAASIAAYYSGGRNAKMVPVAYTLKKYVRKPRGSHPGSVMMDREEVVMAEPKLPVSNEQ